MNPSQKTARPRPPDKGSFPLDHEGKLHFILTTHLPLLSGECKDYMEKYMKCLQQNKSEHSQCRQAAKDYLQCRMEKYF